MKKYILSGVAALGMFVTSCNDYLDINTNPNTPALEDLNADLIFPGAEMAFANSYGDYLRITGAYFAEHYSQCFGTSNYLDYSQFMQSAVRSSSTYTNLCIRTLSNMESVRDIAKNKEQWGTYLAATVIRCATFQTFIDCYGAIPYSESLDENNITPHYDNGEDVYKGIIAELDEALSKTSASDMVCTNFLLPGKSAGEWIKVANALKLRILMRMSGAIDVKSQLQALVAENNFPTSDVVWSNCWKDESGQANPFYQEEFATYFGSTQINCCLNIALLNTMNESDDPRLQAFFSLNGKNEYWGGVSGSNFSTSNDYKSTVNCRPNMHYDDPVYFITVAETEFFMAEYEMKYGNSSNAESHYKAAISASFATAGISDDPENTVLKTYPWNAQNYMQVLGIQKWVALSGVNNFEAYCELRRMKYPAFGNVSGDQIYNELTDAYDPSILPAGELYTPIKVNGLLGNNKLLQRWPYPESSSNRNGNVPAYEGDSSPVFWAK